MKVYTVIENKNNEKIILGIFSTSINARDYLIELQKSYLKHDHFYVVDFELDEGFLISKKFLLKNK